jgi:hypothetical protein
MPDETCIDPPGAGKCRTRHVDQAMGDLAGRQHGVVARRQLLALGLSRHGIDGRVERGLLRVVYPGVYALAHCAVQVEARWMAAVLACGDGVVLSHRSAGQLWELIPRSPHLPEVTRPRSHRRRSGLISHQAVLPEDEVTEVDGIPVTSPFRTIFDLAALLPRQRELERAFHEVEVRQLRDRISLPRLLERYPGRRGAKAVRELLSSREPGGITRNDFEELFVAFLDENGLPRPRLNATLTLRGRFFEPDCMWPEQRLVVELDGRATHGTHEAFEGDRQRDRILLAEGWRWARVTWRQLGDEPAAIAADLRDALYP